MSQLGKETGLPVSFACLQNPMDPDQWRRMLKPRFAALIAELKDLNPALKIAYHTDGFVEPVCNPLEHPISNPTAERDVEELEMIEVEEQNCE